MFKSRLPFNDAKPIRHPAVAPKRKSESDDSSDCRSSLESPTTHCYVLGTRPKRTLPRRALSTGGVEIKSAVLYMDVPSSRLLQPGILCKPNMTPPRSKSATSFRTFDRMDSILPIPNIGNRRIYSPTPPSLFHFHDVSHQSLDDKMDLDRRTSSRYITEKLNDMRLHFFVPCLGQKNEVLRKSVESFSHSRPQASPKIAPMMGRRTSKYFSDEEMHLATSSEDESDKETPVIRSVPSSATFFRKIRFQEMLRNSRNDKNTSPSARRASKQRAPPGPTREPINLLQPSAYDIPPPLLIINKCNVHDPAPCHQSKRVKRLRHARAPPSAHR